MGLFARQPEAVWLEVGFGGGEHLAAQAAAQYILVIMLEVVMITMVVPAAVPADCASAAPADATSATADPAISAVRAPVTDMADAPEDGSGRGWKKGQPLSGRPR